MNMTCKKFLTVGALSIAISTGIGLNAQAANMMPISTVATNTAISTAQNASTMAIHNNAMNNQEENDKGNFIVIGVFLATVLGSIGYIANVETNFISKVKDKVGKIRSKSLDKNVDKTNSL